MFFGSREKNIDKNKRIQKEFNSFTKKVLRTKHMIWFEILDPKRRFDLFHLWNKEKRKFAKIGNSISFNKFLFKKKTSKKFHIPKIILRDKTIETILK